MGIFTPPANIQSNTVTDHIAPPTVKPNNYLNSRAHENKEKQQNLSCSVLPFPTDANLQFLSK